MTFLRYTLLLFLDGNISLITAGGSQSALMIKEDEERIHHLSADLKQEYRAFKKMYHKTSKYKNTVAVQALVLNRHLRKAEQEELALNIESLMDKKYGTTFEFFQGCRNSALLDSFHFARAIKNHSFEEREERAKKCVIQALINGADINYQQELILSRIGAELVGNEPQLIKHEKRFAAETALIHAAHSGYYVVAHYLLTAGIDQYIQDGNGHDALFFAQRMRSASSLDEDHPKGRTAQEEAELLNQNKLKIQKLLRAELAKKALIKEGFTLQAMHVPQVLQDIILAYAAHYAPVKVESKIADEEEKKENDSIAAANFEQPSEISNLSELQQQRIDKEIVAAIKRDGVLQEDIYEMLERGAHLDAQDSMGHTPLMLAIIFNRPDIFETVITFIKSSSSPLKYLLMEDNAGNSALKLAQHYKRDNMVAQLIHAGVFGE